MRVPALSINRVVKSFKANNPILKDISLTVQEGEMVGLIGASGSGKSTLIRLIAGFETIDATGGSIDLFGKQCQKNGRKSRDMTDLRTEIGIIFQQFNLVGRLSLLTNVVVGRLGRISKWRGTLGRFPRADKIKALQALERVGIVDQAYQRASTLSGGQQQRAAIARALAQEAKLILADEPIASLDPASAENVMSTLREINQQDGVTVIVSLHQIDHAFKHCDRIIALKDGRVVQDGAVDDMTKEDLQSLYGVEAIPDEPPANVTKLTDYGHTSGNGPDEQGLGHRHRPKSPAASVMDA
ncbi:MAG: phosphonate ABC transporter ATP-binding protein [Alphaproteobacteria bacterium]